MICLKFENICLNLYTKQDLIYKYSLTHCIGQKKEYI